MPLPSAAPAARAACLAAALVAAPAVQAGRPLATEDADVLARGACEWESFVGRASDGAGPATRAWATQLGCGLGLGAGAQLALAYTHARSAGESVPGWMLGGKVALVPREGDAVGVTLAWALSAERLPGRSLRHEGSVLNLVATKALSDAITAHANLGWARSESAGRGAGTWSLAAEWAAGGGLDLMAEAYGAEGSKPWLGAGVRQAIGDRLSVNASVAVQREDPRVKLWTLGFKLAF